MDVNKIWEAMLLLNRMGLRPAINWNRMQIGIGRLNFTLPEFLQLMEVDLWKPLV